MKRVVVSLMIVGLTTIFTFGQKTEIRTVSNFTGIDASGSFEITVTKGNTEALTIETDNETMLSYVLSEVKNGVLRLYLKSDPNRINIKTLKASVVMRDFANVSLSGVCTLTANDLFNSNSFKGICSGSSNMTVNINTGKMTIEASGTSKIKMKANVTGDTSINVSGASNVQGELKASNMKINAGGTSKTELTGLATNINMDMSGESSFDSKDFTTQTATVKSKDTSRVTINVTEALNVNSSGSSTIFYKGTPTITVNRSGTSKVNKI